MKIYKDNPPYSVGLLEENDAGILKQAFLLSYREDDDEEAVAYYESYPEIYWQKEAQRNKKRVFCVFNEQQLIGTRAVIIQPEKAILTDFYMAAAHRGKGLSHLLYEATLQFAVDNTDVPKIEAHILPDNTASIHLALSYGLKLLEKADEDAPNDAFPYSVYGRFITDMRKPSFFPEPPSCDT